jgi:hypothetical protein
VPDPGLAEAARGANLLIRSASRAVLVIRALVSCALTVRVLRRDGAHAGRRYDRRHFGLRRRGLLGVVVRVGEMVGKVSQERYDQAVAEGRELVAAMARCQWRLGDLAAEIEPMRPHGGSSPEAGEGFGVHESLARFAEDIGLSYATVRTYRWVSSRWPVEHRDPEVSFTVHKILAGIADVGARFEAVANPPAPEGGGVPRWSHDAAKRAVGWKVETPLTVQEKVEAIHDLAREDAVAAVVATDFLRRPQVAAKAMADDTARHLVNDAQFQRFRESVDTAREQVPVVQRVEHSADYLDLVAACAQFVATAGRIVPALRGHAFTDDEGTTVQRGLARVRAAVEWMETAVTTGDTNLDGQLAKLLRGE